MLQPEHFVPLSDVARQLFTQLAPEDQCAGGALREQCLAHPQAKSRTVIKNDYEAEYKAAQAQAQTPAYAKVRQEHPAIERDLSELVRRHDIRHARYRLRQRRCAPSWR